MPKRQKNTFSPNSGGVKMNHSLSRILTLFLMVLICSVSFAENQTAIEKVSSSLNNQSEQPVSHTFQKKVIQGVSQNASKQVVTTSSEEHLLTPFYSSNDAVMTTNLQGGEDISSATVIASLPFSDTGHTTGYVDDYDETACLGQPANAPDVVYSYTPSVDQNLDISLCNSSYLTGLWVYQNDAHTDSIVACNGFSNNCSNPRSEILNMPVIAGNTYYIVIDGFNGDNGDYALEVVETYVPPPFNDSSSVHPAFADGGLGNMILGYEERFSDTTLIWLGSSDDGANFTGGSFSFTGNATYPSVDYWGNDTIFYGTCVGPATESSGGRIYLTKLLNPTNLATWGQSSWNWNNNGWHDAKMAAIACDNTLADWQWGIISWVSSTTYTTPDMTDAPHISYPTTSGGQATVSWFTNLDGCATTDITIDKTERFSYAVYDRLNPTTNTWNLFVRQDLYDSLLSPTGPDAIGYTYTYGSDLQHVQYPSVAAYDGNAIIVTELYDENTMSSRDIVAWTTSGSDVSNFTTSVIVASSDDDRYPQIEHISGSSFVCSFHRGDTLLEIVTNDNGATWGSEIYVTTPTDKVVPEYRAVDITNSGKNIVWEYTNPSIFPDTTIFLHFAPTGLVVDTDSDGIPDDVDNCPLIANAGQEDADGDGIGDVCDDCTDVDGDGYGDPGFLANTCMEDNCPSISNPGQEDADGDGIGDVCDDCTDSDGDGFGDPGYLANTCLDDNCPVNPNPGQEDTNMDGIGDACCCIGIRGNIDGDPEENVDLSDLIALVDRMFTFGPPPPCPLEANIDGDTGEQVDISDLVYLVDYMFSSGPAPASCP